MTTPSALDKAKAVADLAKMIQRGDTIFLVRRMVSRHARNQIIDFRLASKPTTATTGELISVLFGKTYLFYRSGLLLKKDEAPEMLVKALSVELFGEPGHLKAVWM